MIKFRFILFFTLFGFTLAKAQPKTIDKVIGVVSKYPILLSDLQNAMLEQAELDMNAEKCKIFESLVFEIPKQFAKS